ncbi:MAG: hypothetical protein COV96_00270 [Candidatus Zambryskibacteria bacterium CG11_big_fil_rev_8_21_14_0_20_42_18]|uniref:Uncharacterized protein n=1 Tax=Candidatus Zambryskibacteria bacterium CG_4_9_14_3_um_filter_42_15 TaxID=1975112 RepID=A0A2M7WRK9_9BACT|nr:MAG: hypothetical protein COV96_00270 [Candidatus Zambryskibacteria bacterium CG11_big_fil_rev_8_21_14_0_20_42_18]PJA32637.1 MAG: hypothetical protein CO185_02325 [Candidatus Zambryskibacteria bacterium CG_4_9_14_3_um_filter_42_15]
MRPLSVFTLSLVLFFSFFATSTAASFTQNLTLGSRGTEVTALQQYLVAQGRLVIPAGVAFGYFGPLTKAALASWQAANGVLPAVGYWGPISRARYNSVNVSTTTNDNNLSSNSTNTTSTPPLFNNDTPYAFGIRADKVIIFRAFPFEVQSGDIITLEGSGFSRTANNVYFNGGYSLSATSTNGKIIRIQTPSSITEGEYKLFVSNLLGSSENSNIEVKVKITDNPTPSPYIESASIVGDIVTLIGSGFTSRNDLLTTLGNSASPLSSSGTTLTFRLKDLSQYDQISQFTRGQYKFTLWVYVQNEHGINKDPYQIDITI